MSHYTLRGYPGVAGQYIVAAVTGYFYSIACASNAKGVDDSLQVQLLRFPQFLIFNCCCILSGSKLKSLQSKSLFILMASVLFI